MVVLSAALRHRRGTAIAIAVASLAAPALLDAVLPVRAMAAADSAGVSAPAPPPAPDAGVPVVLRGEELLRIRSGAGARSARDRAEGLSNRLRRLIRDPAFEPESLDVEESDVASEIVSDGTPVASVWDGDTVGTGLSRQEVARRWADALRVSLVRQREAYSVRSTILAVVWTVLATLGLWVALAVIGRLRGRAEKATQAWLQARRAGIKRASIAKLEAGRLDAVVSGLSNLLHTAATALLIYTYASLVLGFFPTTRRLSGRLASFVLEPFRLLAASFVEHLPGFIFLAVLAVGTRYLIKMIRFVFMEIAVGHLTFRGFYPEWAMPTYRLVRILVIALAVVVGYPYVPGSSTEAFKGVSIFFGVLVSLGSSSIVSNAIAGVVITYMRAFRVGDTIHVGEHFGRVVETTTFLTRIRTPKNIEVGIPNSVMLASNVVNYSTQAAHGRLLLDSEVTVGYAWPWRQVHALLLRAAERTDGLLREPSPYVLQRSLDAFGVRYQVLGYTNQCDRLWPIRSQLHKNIQDEFNEHGVEIMTPSYEGDRDRPAFTPKERWYTAPAKAPGDPGADQ